MVKGRYMDLPGFLDIAQIVSSYTLTGTATVGSTATVANGPAAIGDTASVGVTGTWSDTPTITYTPLTMAQLGRVALRIKYSEKRPADAYATVSYRSGWFSIDDRDLDSKRTFGVIMLLFTLTETGGREGLPLVTIPSR